MKKITIIMAILVCLSTALFAWDLSRQTQFPTTFSSMSKGGDNFWAVGSGGAVVRSTDNGATWQFVANPGFEESTSTYKMLNTVSFADNMNGVIAGNDGFAAYTTNGGQTWTESPHALNIFAGSDIKTSWYLPSGKIILAGEGGLMIYSSDFGATFNALTSPVTTTVNTVFMEESGMTFIGCGSGVLHKSENFGAAWAPLTLGNTNNPNIYSIRRQGTRLVLTGNKGYVGFSDDNGAVFTHHDNLGSSAVSIYDTAWNGTIGYAVANNGYVVTTNDNFSSVNVVSTYFTDVIRGAYFNASNELLAAAAYGTLMKWNTTSQDWDHLVINAYDLYSVAIGDDNTWYVCGDRAFLYKTSDNGQTYSKITVPGERVSFNALKFFDANNGLVTGKTTGKIFKTTNGGADWTSFTVPGVGTKLFRDFAFVNDQIGYAIGSIYNSKTTDGGATWTTPANTGIGATASLYSAFFKNENIGFAGSTSGTVYVTTDGAENWSTFTLGNKIITDIFFYDDNNGFILTEASVSSGNITQAGKLFRTTNGGMTQADWTEVTMPVTVGTLNGITRLADGTLYIAGYSNNTSQQGTNWAILKS
ncbi:MAG TPA: YCF48-related protein, partial [Candidatus Cloacimonadota bacterium]|nr:YCF48-related protein [Candidatus Cloacimonadota bacterium]